MSEEHDVQVGEHDQSEHPQPQPSANDLALRVLELEMYIRQLKEHFARTGEGP